ncbi:hypothetical protein GCM10019016_043220 [Streptomyces prasinosporus]|uniref:Uncharacterized protein n=1 Tax=Streptomyces prasinosporus TaxID=68256 RepID=A0ABP6TS22_9ACTN|nr:hypothetical protein GCM10010332_07750 [Streptomyces albogriseolus]
MSGAKLPATSTAGTSGPRPVPSVRTAGSTAAAWLSVKGNGTPRSKDRPGTPGQVGRRIPGAGRTPVFGNPGPRRPAAP